LKRQASSEQWAKDRQFIPHPSTWLNGKRWQDEDGGTEAGAGSVPDYLVDAL
jgi:hypothetical protein